jgi:hypothetical protein
MILPMIVVIEPWFGDHFRPPDGQRQILLFRPCTFGDLVHLMYNCTGKKYQQYSDRMTLRHREAGAE